MVYYYYTIHIDRVIKVEMVRWEFKVHLAHQDLQERLQLLVSNSLPPCRRSIRIISDNESIIVTFSGAPMMMMMNSGSKGYQADDPDAENANSELYKMYQRKSIVFNNFLLDINVFC